MTTAYLYNGNGYYIGTTQCQPDPLEEDAWLVPAQSTLIPPPQTEKGKRAVFSAGEWTIEDVVPTPPVQRYVRKLLILQRLTAAGLINEAIAALKSDDVAYEMWSAASEIDSEDAQVLAVLAAIGADPAVIMGAE